MNNKRYSPTFIVGGAPKSATTAIASYLKEHPQIFFSDPKEPFHWCDDFPGLRKLEGMHSEATYRSLFSAAKPKHLQLGEGSTLYLCSESAIPKIIQANPDTKFVFGIRKPSAIANAFHTQMVSHEYENELDFEAAWELQTQRASGASIPNRCPDAKLLQYKDIASVGKQLAFAAQHIPKDQMNVFLFDDFCEAPAEVYSRTLKFLEVEEDHRTSFPVVNSASAPRSKAIIRIRRHPLTRVFVRNLKRWLPAKLANQVGTVSSAALKQAVEREQLSSEFKNHLDSYFKDEVRVVEEIVKRCLNW